MASSSGLSRLLRPRHIAAIGGQFAAEVVRQCERIGFKGDIWPVNPSRDELAGRRCYRHVDELPEAPDASFIAVRRESTIDVVAALARGGAGGAVCYASGFAEAGEEGKALQARLTDAMDGLAVVGPNCYGVLNYLDGAALWPDQHGGTRIDEGVAIVTQSGNVGLSMTMQQRSLPLAYLISVGNQAGLGITDYVEALIEDPRIKAIGLHVESVDDIERFSRAAIAARKKHVPLVALKVGRSYLGSRAALSHTSSLTGDDALYDALFRRLGIARVGTLSEFLEALKFLAVIGPLKGNRIASISCSGGEAALVADLADTLELEMPPLKPRQEQRLREILGPLVAVANPLDYHTFIWGQPEVQRACFGAMMDGKQDITVSVFDYVREPHCDGRDWDAAVEAFIAAKRDVGKPIVFVSTLHENLPERIREQLIENGIAPLQGLQEGMVAIKAAADIGRGFTSKSVAEAVCVHPVNNGDAETLDEWQSKRALEAFGLETPRGQVTDVGTLIQTADAIGYPVALKAVAPALAHKSEAGAVAINLSSGEEVRNAVASMQTLSDRFLVEAMAPTPVAELLVGVTRDAQFGLALTVGAGGILVELVDDVRTLLFPVSAEDVAVAISELRVAKILAGYRGRVAGDWRGAVAAIMAVADYAEANAARLVELEVNPLLVLPEGRGAIAVDALIRLKKEETP